MTEDRVSPSFKREIMIVLLAFAGACIDAASYLALGRVFTANMTGNTIVFVLAIAQGNLGGMLRSGDALLGFVFGAAAGELVLLHFQPSGKQLLNIPDYTIIGALLFEVLDLLAMLLWWRLDGPRPVEQALYPLIALSAVAMGIQSTAVRYLHVGAISTTYITGTVTGLAAGFTDWLRGLIRVEKLKAAGWRTWARVPRGPAFPAVVWGIYAMGAVAGGMAAVTLHSWGLLLPLAAICTVVIMLVYERREEQNEEVVSANKKEI